MTLNKPVFVLGAHKSGTSLLRNLLDGHPQLFVLPLECHFFQMARYWVDYRLRKTMPDRLSYEEIKQAYISLVRYYNITTDSMADANLVGRINVNVFQNYLLDQPVESMADLITEFVQGLYLALHNSSLPDTKRIVEKSVEHAEFAVDLQIMFPDAKFIHILRNPYANLVALRRYKMHDKRKFPVLTPSLIALKNSFYHLYRNQQLIHQYFVIRYEDILQAPEDSMRKIADFIDIEYMDSLLKPTSLGKEWAGNSSRGKTFKGISAENINLWEADISDFEINIINEKFEFIIEDYGYKKLIPKRGYLFPVSHETLKTYLINRIASRQV